MIAINKYTGTVFSESCGFVNDSIVHNSQIEIKANCESEVQEKLVEYLKKAYGKPNADIAYLDYGFVGIKEKDGVTKFNTKYAVVFDDDLWSTKDNQKDFFGGFGDDD